MMFFWSEIPKWIYAVILLAIGVVCLIIFNMVRGQVSVSAGAVQYLDDYNKDGTSSNVREGKRVAPAGGFRKRETDPEYNTTIERKKDSGTPFVPSQQGRGNDVPNPRGNGRGGGRN